MKFVRSSLAAMTCCALAGSGFGDTWTVGATGDFTDIQSAVDAAGEQVLPLVVPVDASLLGVVVHFQWLELDPSQNGLSNPTLLPVR